jgi:hypothetical protein
VLPNLLTTAHAGYDAFKGMGAVAFVTNVFQQKEAFAGRRVLSTKPRDPQTLMFRTIRDSTDGSASPPLIRLLAAAGVPSSWCFDAVVLPTDAYLLGMLYRPESDPAGQTISVFLCALAADPNTNPRKSRHVRLLLVRESLGGDKYQVFLRVSQFIHAFVKAADHKHTVLDQGLSASEVDTILAAHHDGLAKELKKELEKTEKKVTRKRDSEEACLRRTGLESEFFTNRATPAAKTMALSSTRADGRPRRGAIDPVSSAVHNSREKRRRHASNRKQPLPEEAEDEVASTQKPMLQAPQPSVLLAPELSQRLASIKPKLGGRVLYGALEVFDNEYSLNIPLRQ